MKDEHASDYWDDISRPFTESGAQGLWRLHSDRVNCALIAEWLADRHDGKLLKTDLFDEAVSDGLYPCLARHAGSVHGIDISGHCVQKATDRHPGLETTLADIRDLPFEDGQFDCVVSISTLDHFHTREEIDRSLAEIFRVLQPGGTLLVSFDNPQNPIVLLRNVLPFELLRKIGVLPYFVGKTYGRRSLVAALGRAGFRVQDTRALLHCPRVLAIPLAERQQRKGSPESRRRLADRLFGFERMASWPTAYFTGHFIAALAVRPRA